MQKDKMIVLENGNISLGEKGYKLVARICGQNFPIKSTAFFEEMREFLCYIPNNCRNNIRKAKKNFHALLMSMLAYIISARAIFMLKPTCLFFEE